jgi:glycosyltransferase involved in cell wall biosynthesis
MIHTSSYDRGIIHLLKMWPDIIKEVPDAELHLFYGWNTYDAMVEKGFRDPSFKQIMQQMMAQPGITDHGRVGHKPLIKALQQSSIYVYPSHFEEISCISAMKAQAAGCIPVVTDYAALAETVKEGIKIPGKCGDPAVDEMFKSELISLLKRADVQEEIRPKVLANKEQFGWDRVAKQWKEELFEECALVQ